MIKINNQDIADIKYNGQSIKRVMQNGVQIWPSDTPPDVPNIPTELVLSEYEVETLEIPTGITLKEVMNIPTGIILTEVIANIDWNYTKMYIGEGGNVNLVTLYFTGKDADVTSVPAITDWVLDPFNVVSTVTVFVDRVELVMSTAFDSSSSVTIDYTPGIDKLQDIDGYLLTALVNQPLNNLLKEPIDWDYTKMYIGEGGNVNLVTLYFTGKDADVMSIPEDTDFSYIPFNEINDVAVFTDRVELTMDTAFDSNSSGSIYYEQGVPPLQDIDGHLLTDLDNQALENLLP